MAHAHQLVSHRELGTGPALNQNVVVRCTTITGQASNEQCQLRRHVRCDDRGNCGGWQPWRDIRNPSREFPTWQAAADACCRAKGLR
ncbi:MAG: hypothetical protein FWC83_01340 [Alphaproteobacteria bacterium]|nr:hypothetical protein [Alphaproteobacteria bacterium]